MKASRFFAHHHSDPQLIEPPIRAELFSIERLEQHAESLAVAQSVVAGPQRGLPLDRRLRENTRVLGDAYHTIINALHRHQPITPAAEWLVDNEGLVEVMTGDEAIKYAEKIGEFMNDIISERDKA